MGGRHSSPWSGFSTRPGKLRSGQGRSAHCTSAPGVCSTTPCSSGLATQGRVSRKEGGCDGRDGAGVEAWSAVHPSCKDFHPGLPRGSSGLQTWERAGCRQGGHRARRGAVTVERGAIRGTGCFSVLLKGWTTVCGHTCDLAATVAGPECRVCNQP